MAHTCVRIVPIKEPLGYKSDVAESKKQEGKANTFHGLRHFCGKYAHLGAAPHGTGVVKKQAISFRVGLRLPLFYFRLLGAHRLKACFKCAVCDSALDLQTKAQRWIPARCED